MGIEFTDVLDLTPGDGHPVFPSITGISSARIRLLFRPCSLCFICL